MATMSPLRCRMIEDMTIRNLSPATHRSYLHVGIEHAVRERICAHEPPICFLAKGVRGARGGSGIRMAAINATRAAVPTDEDAVNRAWSMINTIDVPKGILYWRWVNDEPQFTSYRLSVT